MFYRVVTFSLVFLVSCLWHVYAETYAGSFQVSGRQTWVEEECYWDIILDFTTKVTLPPGDGWGYGELTIHKTYVGSNSTCGTGSNYEIIYIELLSSGSFVDGSFGEPLSEIWTWSSIRTENSLEGEFTIEYHNETTGLLYGPINLALALFSDDFEDGDVSDWTTKTGSWESWEVIFGRLVGSSDRKTDIISPFLGGSIYTVVTPVILQSKGVKASMLAWYADKNSYVELQISERKVLLKQKFNGNIIMTTKSICYHQSE